MSPIEKWNKLAKKKIYINESLEIPVGRLIYIGIIFMIQLIWCIVIKAPLDVYPILGFDFLAALHGKKKEN